MRFGGRTSALGGVPRSDRYLFLGHDRDDGPASPVSARSAFQPPRRNNPFGIAPAEHTSPTDGAPVAGVGYIRSGWLVTRSQQTGKYSVYSHPLQTASQASWVSTGRQHNGRSNLEGHPRQKAQPNTGWAFCSPSSFLPVLWPAGRAVPHSLPTRPGRCAHSLLPRCERPVHSDVQRLALLGLCLPAATSMHHCRVRRRLLADHKLHCNHLLIVASAPSTTIVRPSCEQVKIVKPITILSIHIAPVALARHTLTAASAKKPRWNSSSRKHINSRRPFWQSLTIGFTPLLAHR